MDLNKKITGFMDEALIILNISPKLFYYFHPFIFYSHLGVGIK